jgi:hypothetical protein
MESLITYLIRCVLVSGLLTGYYMIALRGRRMHTFNRFYLLSSLAVALVLPLVRIHWDPWPSAGHGTIERVLIGVAPAAAGKSAAAFWWRMGLGASLVVSGVLLLASLGKIRSIYRIKRASRCTPMDGYELVETEAPGTPFSFFRNLFWRRGMDREGAAGHSMLAHELAHIRGRHSWDILGMEAVLCVFWMNPFFWYIRRELTLVLEFAADAASGAEGDPELLARMLLQAYDGGRYPTLSNAFFHSPIKRRLVMITNNHRSRRTWMRKALVVPVIAVAVLAFACSKQQPAQQADAFDAQKLKAEQLALKLLTPDQLKALKMRVQFTASFKRDDEQKLQMKVMQDSLMKVYYQVGPSYRVDGKTE